MIMYGPLNPVNGEDDLSHRELHEIHEMTHLYDALKEWWIWNWQDEPIMFSIWIFGPPIAGAALWSLPHDLPLFILGSAIFWLLGVGFYIRLTLWRERNHYRLVSDQE